MYLSGQFKILSFKMTVVEFASFYICYKKYSSKEKALSIGHFYSFSFFIGAT